MTITMTMTMAGDTEHEEQEEQEETPSLLPISCGNLSLWFAIWVRWLRLVTMCSWLVPVTVARFCVATMFVAPLRLKKLLVYIPSSWTFVLYRRGSRGDSACLPDSSSLSSMGVAAAASAAPPLHDEPQSHASSLVVASRNVLPPPSESAPGPCVCASHKKELGELSLPCLHALRDDMRLHHSGTGSRRVDRVSLRKVLDHTPIDLQPSLRYIMQGATITADRMHRSSRGVESANCPFCLSAVETETHRWWRCPHWDALRAHHIGSLVDLACEQLGSVETVASICGVPTSNVQPSLRMHWDKVWWSFWLPQMIMIHDCCCLCFTFGWRPAGFALLRVLPVWTDSE